MAAGPENVKVIVRCRPMNKKEQDLNCECIVKMKNCTVETWDPSEGPAYPKQFTFDSTYDQDSQTETIYNDICYPLVESVLEGYNSTIFVYGQTGCGKSHTMEGTPPPSSEKGIISRAFDHIFETISLTTGVKYLALISYLEIYNETIRDLLVQPDKTNALCLKEHPTDGVTVPGLTTHPVHNAAECEHYFNLGAKNRIIATTLMNQNSSRSHCIFTISIEQITSQNNNENESIRKGKLNLVDLAGSERQAKTGATGDRLKEATKINLSLSALGNVISALVDGRTKHVPYRDSKLTRLLQDALGGNTKTLMVACIGPAHRNYSETLSTLRYANRAKNIHNQPRVNEDPKDAILRQYQREIEQLRAVLAAGGAAERTREQHDAEVEQLRRLHESERTEKEHVIGEIEAMRRRYEAAPKEQGIIERIETLKGALIGGERAGDRELVDRRKRRKMAAERRAGVIATVLAKIDFEGDRELLENEYRDISNELGLKSDLLRKYRNKIRNLNREVKDLLGEFEVEREDYLETIRKQERTGRLMTQIAEKLAGNLKRECNYSDLERIKGEAVWLEDSQRFKLPEVVTSRMKLPPAGRFYDIQTAPARLSSDEENCLEKKLEQSEEDDLITNYFQPTTKRASELLNQSAKLAPKVVFNKWRGSLAEFTRRGTPTLSDNRTSIFDASNDSFKAAPKVTSSFGSLPWASVTSDRKPFRLDALPTIGKNGRKRVDSSNVT